LAIPTTADFFLEGLLQQRAEEAKGENQEGLGHAAGDLIRKLMELHDKKKEGKGERGRSRSRSASPSSSKSPSPSPSPSEDREGRRSSRSRR
jgi:hypothetical protein